MAADIPNVRLKLASNPQSVVLVRQLLTGLAEVVGLSALELNELNTAVSEAANNVVLHAYDGGEGPLEVDVGCGRAGLSVAVRDRGRGMSPGQDPARAWPTGGIGIGLPVIQALAREVEFKDVTDGGSEVLMQFTTTRPHALRQPPQDDGLDEMILAASPLADVAAALAVAPAPLARAVIPRMLSALAARAHFPTDRISDTRRLAHALVAHIDDSLSASHLNLQASVAPRELRLRVGPLHAGHGNALIGDLTTDGLGAVLDETVDERRIVVTPAGPSELLSLRLAARRLP
jgi:serine/threonine-protein kinase RsbW